MAGGKHFLFALALAAAASGAGAAASRTAPLAVSARVVVPCAFSTSEPAAALPGCAAAALRSVSTAEREPARGAPATSRYRWVTYTF